ncbi:MAG: phosphoethanolamine--lipid A transferase [Woeseiaceae bacterium]
MLRYLKTPEALIFVVSVWIALTCNLGFWRVIAESQPPGVLSSIIYFASFLVLAVGLISLVMLLLAWGPVTRVVLILALLIAAAAGYSTLTLGTLFDSGMLTNIIETNSAEAVELLSPWLVAFIAVFALLPAIAVWRYRILPRRVSVAVLQRSVGLLLALAMIGGAIFTNQKEIFSVARNHHELRHMIAPVNVISAGYSLTSDLFETPAVYQSVAVDAEHANATAEHRKPRVHVLIIGETARAANFSLNGYLLFTNPELTGKVGVQFLEAHSCGTATAVSLPCMFSIQERAAFDRNMAGNEDNLLDVIVRAGYEVFWIDNGNSCKGVCDRVHSEDVHSLNGPEFCPDGTCYDEILVEALQTKLDQVKGDTVIVLHQLGSHGPAYYRRYPEKYRVFTPDCRSPDFTDCSQEEVSNAYDNTIVYTDHVIAKAIDVLQAASQDFQTSLIYISDHGESLGERNMYLHGMPYKLAPAEQTTIPMIMWLGDGLFQYGQSMSTCAELGSIDTVSHDNLFHTELGLLRISTAAYKPELDLFSGCRVLKLDQLSAQT